ncbi:MAG: pyridoxamine 5-phosphate oxidase [Sediminimonas qiaohouensis]|uniref:Pyridoxamine 5-phosphate oxidase n=1 Tax=Sediminimonas qiaohouensis TaxID=552061 RepID=A0A7C9HNI2_9RHOB|nr:pyridoxamine 5'-phosphate oxidase family protein [Sediminimonas qiaohouensis]MTJ05908.1 pyridoxamine 5-phosphate oxidase [Sediminimonas qiaohouensis]
MQDTPAPGIRPTDDDAREMARGLLAQARTAALAVLDPDTAGPMASRIAFGRAPDGLPLSLISDLAAHSRALAADPRCSLLLDGPTGRGDPLNHPRLTLQARAHFVRHGADRHEALLHHYLAQHPKAKLYAGFADFAFVLFDVDRAMLNGGFGKAYHLTPADMGLAQPR